MRRDGHSGFRRGEWERRRRDVPVRLERRLRGVLEAAVVARREDELVFEDHLLYALLDVLHHLRRALRVAEEDPEAARDGEVSDDHVMLDRDDGTSVSAVICTEAVLRQ
jgi:hypothetical protein